RGEDEPRVQRAEPERGQRAGRLGLDHDVGPRGQPTQSLGPLGPPPVERDAALAGVVEPEEEASLRILDALPEGWDGAQWRALRRLDQDDVGAEAGEELPDRKSTRLNSSHVSI